PCRAEQNGFFRAAAGAPHAPQLQNANRSSHDAAVAGRVRTPRCGARETRASARATSNTDATTNRAGTPTARRVRLRKVVQMIRREVVPQKLNSEMAIRTRAVRGLTGAATIAPQNSPSAIPWTIG